jgi:hypothetical protein
VGVLLLWAVGESVSGLDNVTRASAIKDAGLWLADRATTPESLVTNDRRLAYYAGRHKDLKYIEPRYARLKLGLTEWKWWTKGSYLALRLSRKDKAREDLFTEALGKSPVKEFAGESGDRVLVFKIYE